MRYDLQASLLLASSLAASFALAASPVPAPADPIADAWRRAVEDTANHPHSGADGDSSRVIRAWQRRSTAPSTTLFEKFPGNPVIPLGKRGEPDDRHAEYPSVVTVGDRLWMFYSAYGPRRRWEIAAAVSSDGIHWTRLGVVLAPDGAESAWDSVSVAGPSVIVDPEAPPDERFRMWYAGKGSDLYEGIGLATSADGQQWRRRGRVLGRGERGAWDGAQLVDPAVIRVGGGYRMYYCGGRSASGLFAIGVALSADGWNWVRHPDNPIYAAPDPGLYTADVVVDDDGFILFLSAPDSEKNYEIEAVHSVDGLQFDPARSRLVLTPSRDGSWDNALVYGMDAFPVGDTIYLWFNGIYDNNVTPGGQIGLARASRDALRELLAGR